MNTQLTLDLIRQAPKALLHDHLDGGLRPATVAELAEQGVKVDYVQVWRFAHAEGLSFKKTYGPPRLQAAIFDNMISLHKRIRHVGTKAAAKMEIRASQSS